MELIGFNRPGHRTFNLFDKLEDYHIAELIGDYIPSIYSRVLLLDFLRESKRHRRINLGNHEKNPEQNLRAGGTIDQLLYQFREKNYITYMGRTKPDRIRELTLRKLDQACPNCDYHPGNRPPELHLLQLLMV
jgi:hypothetical protein